MGCLFLYNPNSGKGGIAKRLDLIRSELEAAFDEVDVHATASAEDLEACVSAGADQYDAIVFSGGDGTFHHVLQGLNGKRVALGYLPSGTANDVARTLGIPKNIKKALRIIRMQRIAEIDCMRVNDTGYAAYIAAAGAFTSVTYTTPQTRKRRLGWAAYAVEGLKEFKFDSFPVTAVCDGKKVKTDCALALVMNGKSVAGFKLNERASVRDGILEVALVKQAKKYGFWGRLATCFSIGHLFLFGFRVKKKDIVKLQGKRVEILTDDEVVWDFDGEKGNTGNVKIEAVPRQVKIFVPKNKKI